MLGLIICILTAQSVVIRENDQSSGLEGNILSDGFVDGFVLERRGLSTNFGLDAFRTSKVGTRGCLGRKRATMEPFVTSSGISGMRIEGLVLVFDKLRRELFNDA